MLSVCSLFGLLCGAGAEAAGDSPAAAAAAQSMRGGPVDIRYEANGDLLVDFPYWQVGDSSLEMAYESRSEWKEAKSRFTRSEEQIGINLDMKFPAAKMSVDTRHEILPGAILGSGDGYRLESLEYALDGDYGRLHYGAKYELDGSRYRIPESRNERLRQRDRDRTEVWARISPLHRVSVSLSAEQQNRHSGRGADASHYKESLAGLSGHVTIYDWPQVTLSAWYKEGDRAARHVEEDLFREPSGIRLSGASLHVQNDWSSHSASIGQAIADEGSASGRLERYVSHEVSSTFYPPTSPFSFGAAYALSDDLIADAGYCWSSAYSSRLVWAAYAFPGKKVSLKGMGYFDDYSTADGRTRFSGSYASATLAFDSVPFKETRLPLALTMTYNSYHDELYPSANTSELALWLQFGLTAPVHAESYRGHPAHPW